MLHLYSIFHLNLAFSSIEEESRPDVIRRCYRPLLDLARSRGIPLGIEVSGYTLEQIHAIDPDWVEELGRLCDEGLCELIGSGYAQIIGPLVPAEVNRANQRIGLEVYKRLLGRRPRIALVCEQAYSAGLVRHYLDAGFEGIVMEWDNPGSANPDWDPLWRYLPQYACGQGDEKIPVIWNKSIPFQKFQRYAHGENSLQEYLAYLEKHCSQEVRSFPLYGNDAEVFDFRPGRFHTEAALEGASEWERIAEAYQALAGDGCFALVLPSRVLELMDQPGAGHSLHLESAAHPVPVKKQAKYNLIRWAVTGRDDLTINTACRRIFEAMQKGQVDDPQAWKELCYLWSSDFRTHITSRRWDAYLERLEQMQARYQLAACEAEGWNHTPLAPESEGLEQGGCRVSRDRQFIEVETAELKIRLNTRRGLAIESLVFKAQGSFPLIGTLPHGFFDDIAFGADYYSGHLVLEIPGQHKVADLNPVEASISSGPDGILVSGRIATPLGELIKEISIHSGRPEVGLVYRFLWPDCPAGSLRLGHMTLNPEAFDLSTLRFSTHNGGALETFTVDAMKPFNHMAPVSALVSAHQGLGMTEGLVEIGDARRGLSIRADLSCSALIAQGLYHPVAGSYLFRLAFSAQELDDTSCKSPHRTTFASRTLSLKISPR